MTRPEYVEFLGDALGNATRVSRNGAVHFECCDWRHVTEIMEAGRLAYCETLNIVVWVKSNAGQGSFYRSQHEFVVVFRAGEAAHEQRRTRAPRSFAFESRLYSHIASRHVQVKQGSHGHITRAHPRGDH
jgi:hypothetical protein